MKGRTIIQILCVVLGAIFVILGTLALTVVPYFVAGEVSKRTYLGYDGNGSYNEMTRKWVDPPYIMSMQFWIFSVANADAVLKSGSYPRLIEKGPYTFVLLQKKRDVKFYFNDTQVLYRNDQTYFFNSSLSCNTCNLMDTVTIPNPVFQSIVDIANASGSKVKAAIELVLSFFPSEGPFTTTTVGKMLFDGFEDPIIHRICDHFFIRQLCNRYGIPEKIGFFYGQNNTDDGDYTIDTGLVNAKDLGKVYTYNRQTRLPDKYWYSPQARMINGTNQLFGPGLSSSERLYMFLGQMKRSIYLQYKKKSKVDGVPTWRFITPPELYDPALPENKGFCNPKTPIFFDSRTQPVGCLPKGFLDISSTQPGNPRIYISGSHFYDSPPSVYEHFEGFKQPTAKHDESQFDIEPTTGVIVRVKQRSQINVGMVSGTLRVLGKMRSMIVPVLWFNETVYFDAETRDELLSSLVFVQNTANIAGIALLAVGLVLLAVFVILFIVSDCLKKESEDEERLIVDAETDDASHDNFPSVEQLPRIPPLPPQSEPPSVDELLSTNQ